MATRLPPLNSLRAFEVASRLMSFQKAAEELNVTPSALSYQIRQLEDHLQIPLFTRLNRAVELTEAGARVAPGIQDAFERLAEAVARLRPQTPPNVLTVSTGPAFGAKWLAPRLHRFLERYPEIDIRISANLKLVDLRADEIDVTVRFGGGNYPGLHVEPLSDESVLPLVSPALLRQHGGRLTLDDLRSMTLLHDDSAGFLPNAVTWAEWLRRARANGVDASRGPRFSHADHAIEAAIDGAGVVLGRLLLASRDIAAGRLVAPFDLVLRAQAGFFLCCLPESVALAKVKAFRDFVLDEVARESEALQAIRAGAGRNWQEQIVSAP